MAFYRIDLKATRLDILSLSEWVELGETLREFGAPVTVPTVGEVVAAGGNITIRFEIEAENLWDARGVAEACITRVREDGYQFAVEGKPTEMTALHSMKVREVSS